MNPPHRLKSEIKENKNSCLKCDSSFRSAKTLFSHEKKCTAKLISSDDRNSESHKLSRKCKKCFGIFESMTALKNHQEKLHKDKNKPRPYRIPRQCPKCPQVFMTVKALKYHQKIHNELEVLEEHSYNYDESLDLYICQTCSAEFQKVHEVEKHVQIHVDQSYSCVKCPEKFKFLRDLFYHMENHLENGKIPCPMCSFKTNSKKKLLPHLNSSHLQTNVCQQCGKVCSNRPNLYKHLIQHDENKKQSCIVCSSEFFGERALERHQINMHKPEIRGDPSLLYCSICRTEFKTLNLFKYHVEKAHTKTVPKKDIERNFLCDICGRGFKDADNLKKHKISHTESRPFMCFQCGKAFKQKYVLTYHQRIHTGERPYSCGYCEKSFRQWTPYKVHLRGHTGEKPYVCKICSKGFTTNQGLKLHMKNCIDPKNNIGSFVYCQATEVVNGASNHPISDIIECDSDGTVSDASDKTRSASEVLSESELSIVDEDDILTLEERKENIEIQKAYKAVFKKKRRPSKRKCFFGHLTPQDFQSSSEVLTRQIFSSTIADQERHIKGLELSLELLKNRFFDLKIIKERLQLKIKKKTMKNGDKT